MKLFETDKIEITDEFQNALNIMENTRNNVFITGRAGTGKSTLLQHFCNNTTKNIVILAPTGIAAINIKGVTIHSFFRFPFHIVEKKDIEFLGEKVGIFRNLDAIVIDEISMVRADLMNAIDLSLRKNTGNKSIPFGGVQLIMIGDLYQLPPVVRDQEKEFLKDRYGGIYFFNNKVFKKIGLEKVILTKIFRQKNNEFKNLLNKVRERKIALIDINKLNTRVCEFNPENGPAIVLATTNKIVNGINQQKLNQIKVKEYGYKAFVQGKFNEKDFPADGDLRLRIGAQVMMLNNDNKKPQRWVNGSLGQVIKLDKNFIVINISGINYEIKKSIWEIFDYKYNKRKKKIEKQTKGVFEQYPIKLAWAVTIHKSQGKTFERVIIDLGRGAFVHGQTYVALSRCVSFEEIYLRTPIRFSDIILDQEVEKFHI